ncbi:MAG: hypothetical protein ABI658_08775 [Acidimicrobiales bacterium]
MNRWHLVLLFTATLAVIVVIATIAVATASPKPNGEICEPGRLCGGPPPGPGLLASAKWESTGLGYSFEYNSDVLAVTREDANGVELKVDAKYAGRLTVTAMRAGSVTREAMLDKEIGRLGKTMLGLKSDTANATRIFGPTLGYIDGVGGSYRGTSNTPQSPSSPVTIVAVAATDGHLVAVVTFALEGVDDPKIIKLYRGLVDGVAKTFRWGPIPE